MSSCIGENPRRFAADFADARRQLTSLEKALRDIRIKHPELDCEDQLDLCKDIRGMVDADEQDLEETERF